MCLPGDSGFASEIYKIMVAVIVDSVCKNGVCVTKVNERIIKPNLQAPKTVSI